MPSGINPTLGCSPLTGCTEKDYYLPGKGVWAPKQSGFSKAKMGAIGGAIGGAIDLLSACDIRYCSSDAWFTIKEVDVGLGKLHIKIISH